MSKALKKKKHLSKLNLNICILSENNVRNGNFSFGQIDIEAVRPLTGKSSPPRAGMFPAFSNRFTTSSFSSWVSFVSCIRNLVNRETQKRIFLSLSWSHWHEAAGCPPEYELAPVENAGIISIGVAVHNLARHARRPPEIFEPSCLQHFTSRRSWDPQGQPLK